MINKGIPVIDFTDLINTCSLSNQNIENLKKK